MRDLTQHLTTRADDSRAPPVFASSEEELLISEDGTALTQGALTVTQSDVVFYTRKEAKGGVKVVWSCTVPEISEYTIGKVNDHQKGLMLTLNGSETPVKFVSSPITKQESAFRKALGWDS